MKSDMTILQKRAFECLFKSDDPDFDDAFGHTPIKKLDELTLGNRLQILEQFIPKKPSMAMIYGQHGTSTGFDDNFYTAMDITVDNLETLDAAAASYDLNDRFSMAFVGRIANSADKLAENYAVATLDDMVKYAMKGRMDELADKWHTSVDAINASGIIDRFGPDAYKAEQVRSIVEVPLVSNEPVRNLSQPAPKPLVLETNDGSVVKKPSAYEQLKAQAIRSDYQNEPATTQVEFQ